LIFRRRLTVRAKIGDCLAREIGSGVGVERGRAVSAATTTTNRR
jgi:hypothetical protein